MIYTPLTNKALRLAYAAHHGQTDNSGQPYIFHPYHLAEQMTDEVSVCVALLHDVAEDRPDHRGIGSCGSKKPPNRAKTNIRKKTRRSSCGNIFECPRRCAERRLQGSPACFNAVRLGAWLAIEQDKGDRET